MRIFASATLSVAAIALLAPSASAQSHYRSRAYDAPAYRAYEAAPSPGYYCVKECVQDFSPCDPAEYKRTDGRCTSPTAGIR